PVAGSVVAVVSLVGAGGVITVVVIGSVGATVVLPAVVTGSGTGFVLGSGSGTGVVFGSESGGVFAPHPSPCPKPWWRPLPSFLPLRLPVSPDWFWPQLPEPSPLWTQLPPSAW